MKKSSLKNVAVSVHDRLLNIARSTDRPFNELLQYYAMERFLYRLSMSDYVGDFVLKGALMLTVWETPQWRPTKDIDLLGNIDSRIDSVVAAIKDICLQDVENDGLVFDPDSVHGEQIIGVGEHVGVRVKFRGNLGNARIAMQLDIGFGDFGLPLTSSVEFPTMLDFPSPQLLGYSRESSIAEKFDAMIKLSVLNSRMKDFFDIWLLCKHYDFDGRRLAEAILSTFSNRGTELPNDLSAKMAAVVEDPTKDIQWRGFIKNSRLENAPDSFERVVDPIVGFLGPIVKTLFDGNAFELKWEAPGPWV